MRKRNKSFAWAANQFVNRSLQGVSYSLDKGLAKPTRIIFCLTLRCNIKCQQCAIWRMPAPEELSAEQWKGVIYDIRKWMGPYRVQLAGGEIFVRKDVAEIVKFATDNGVLTGLVSNGTMITKKIAEDIVSAGLGYIHISVDGTTPKTHDEIRGIPGLYKKTVVGIDNVIEAGRGSGMSICVATVIMKNNIHEILDLVDWVQSKDVDGVIFNPLGPTIDSDPDWYKKTPLFFDDLTEVNAVLDKLIERKKKGAKILNPPEQFEEMKKYFAKPQLLMRDQCMVGITNLSITCNGDIHTCFKMPPIGNVKDIPVSKAWNSDKANNIRRMIKNCNIHCSPGNFVYRRTLMSEVMRYLRYG